MPGLNSSLGYSVRQQDQVILGPFRVLPGRLSVSRTFGDIEAKKPKYGGNPKVVIADPEVKAFKVQNNYDFVLLACKIKFINIQVTESLTNSTINKCLMQPGMLLEDTLNHLHRQYILPVDKVQRWFSKHQWQAGHLIISQQ